MNQLSVCMIARNEAARIALALESVRPIADEIIVVDTGSTDDTIAIAEAHGARLVHHRWNDDFAAARNAALPHIRGRWILWLDADEQVAPDSCEKLGDYLSLPDAMGFAVYRNDYIHGLTRDMPRGDYMATQIVRIFRSDLGIHYTGRCHEQPAPPLRELGLRTGLRMYSSPLTLEHDCGYFSAGRVEKSNRNTRLLELEVRDRPGRLYWMIQCAAGLFETPGRAFDGHQMMKDVLASLAAASAAPQPPCGMAAIALEYAAFPLPEAAAISPLPLDRDGAIGLADRWFPNAAPVVWLRARRAYEDSDFTAAIPLFKRLLTMGERKSYDVDVAFDPAIVSDAARLNLGVCLLREARLEEAEEVLSKIALGTPRYAEAKANLATIAELRARFPDSPLVEPL